MKAEELLWLYELGERNFRQQDLSGMSFRGKNLSGVDFSGSDIRGADFTDATLRGAQFVRVRAGLLWHHAIVLFGLMLAGAALLGVLAGVIGVVVELRPQISGLELTITQWTVFIVLMVFSFTAVQFGIGLGFIVFVSAFFITAAFGLISPGAMSVAAVLAVAITAASFIAAVATLAILVGAAAALAFNSAVAVLVVGVFTMTLAVAVATTQATTSTLATASIALAVMSYIAWRALHGDPRHVLLRRAAIALGVRWGTSFRGADLTNADFSQTRLQSIDFSRALLTHIHWSENVAPNVGVSYTKIW